MNRKAVRFSKSLRLDTEEMVYEAKQTLEKTLDKVTPVASAVMSKLKSGSDDTG